MRTVQRSLPGSTREARRFVLDFDRRLERFDRAILIAEWNLFTGRSTQGSGAWQLQRGALLSDERILAWVRSALTKTWPHAIQRRLALLERILVEAQVEQHPDVVRLRSRLQRTIAAYRPRWKGKRVNRAFIWRVEREDPNPAQRRRAHYALDPLYRPLEEPMRELVRIRNERARAQGFRSFTEMRLRFEGITPSRLEELADAAVAAAPRRLRALPMHWGVDTTRSGWYPWDAEFAARRAAPLPERSFPRRSMLPTILQAIRGWGFRTERMRFRVVFHDLPAGGLTLAPDPPDDVRILVHPTGGWLAYHVMFHEVGHAVHSASIRAPRHLLRWHENVPGFGGFHEGIGGLFEEIARNPRWLAQQPGVGPAQAQAFVRVRQDFYLSGAAWVANWMRIEQALYRNPDRDPSNAAGREARRWFGYDDYPPTSFVDSFFVDTPAYAPNYLFATLLHYQLCRTIREKFGDPLWPNRSVGPWLSRQWFAPGSQFDWVKRVKEVTGRPFGARDFQAAHRSEDLDAD